jgi:hypothetical protein
MRTVWPMLWLLPTIGGTAAIAWRIAGREAALIALLLALVGLPAFHQFRPGRIDHHNVQIALTLLAVAATVWSDRLRWTAVAAGAVTGLALAIGLECLPYLIVCAAAFALRYVVDRNSAQAASDYGLALAASSLAAFLVTVGPDHWTRAACDMIAVNWVALVTVGGLGLALAARLAHTMPARLAATLALGAAATALFLAFEPRCLRGPYAMMDAAVWPIWLAHVREMQPLIPLLAQKPLTAIAIATFPVAALIAALVLLRDRDIRRDFGYLCATAALVAAFITTLAAIKVFSYATWLGMPLVAAFALHLFAALRLRALVPRFAVGLMLTPAALSIGAISVADAAGLSDRESFSFARPEREACLKTENYAPLARLPAGLIAADIDFGPFLLALTPHAILAAPYHRLSGAILAAHTVFASPPEAARDAVKRLGVTYVLTCGPRPPNDLAEPARAASLWGRLQVEDIPAWLERVADVDRPFQIYRVKS